MDREFRIVQSAVMTELGKNETIESERDGVNIPFSEVYSCMAGHALCAHCSGLNEQESDGPPPCTTTCSISRREETGPSKQTAVTNEHEE